MLASVSDESGIFNKEGGELNGQIIPLFILLFFAKTSFLSVKNAQKITLVGNDKKTPQENLRRFSKLTFCGT